MLAYLLRIYTDGNIILAHIIYFIIQATLTVVSYRSRYYNVQTVAVTNLRHLRLLAQCC